MSIVKEPSASFFRPGNIGELLKTRLIGFSILRRAAPGSGRVRAGALSQRFTGGLLSTDAGHRLDPHHRRRVPFAGECLGLRAIETHAHVERPLRRGQPVGFFVFAGALVLEVKSSDPSALVLNGM